MTRGLTPSDDGFFEAVVETSVDPIVVIDDDFVLLYVSQSITQILDFEPAEYLGKSIVDFLEPSSLTAAVAAIDDLAKLPPDPEWVGAPLRLVLRNADGSPVEVDALARDVIRTGVRGFVVRLHRAGASQALHDAVDTILEGTELEKALWHLAAYAQHRITRTVVTIGLGWTSTGFSRMIGARPMDHPTAEDLAAIAAALASGEPVVDIFDDLAPATRRAAIAEGFEACWCAPVLGRDITAALIVWYVVPGPPAASFRHTIDRSVNLTRLALEWMDTQRRLAWAVSHDPLTRLTNRTDFYRALEASVGTPRAVLFCDLDDFKPVNENLGHRMGDRVLTAAAGRIAGACEHHTVARLGGDEFGVLMTRIASVDAALAVASRINARFDDPITVEGVRNQLGVTIGVAFDPSGTVASDQLLEMADRQLRDGKVAGKNLIRSITVGA